MEDTNRRLSNRRVVEEQARLTGIIRDAARQLAEEHGFIRSDLRDIVDDMVDDPFRCKCGRRYPATLR